MTIPSRPIGLLILHLLMAQCPAWSQTDTIEFRHKHKSSGIYRLTVGDFNREDEIRLDSGYILRGIIGSVEDSILILFLPELPPKKEQRDYFDSLNRLYRKDIRAYNKAFYCREYQVPLSRVREIRVHDYDYGRRKKIRKILGITAMPVSFGLVFFVPYPFVAPAAMGVFYLVDYSIRMKRFNLEKDYSLDLE